MKKIFLKKIKVANNIFSKAIGVIGWKDFGENNGLLLTDTNSIHTFFVRFSIDVVFLDKNGKVLKTVMRLRQFRISPIIWQASQVLEMPDGAIEKNAIETGDIISF